MIKLARKQNENLQKYVKQSRMFLRQNQVIKVYFCQSKTLIPVSDSSTRLLVVTTP